MNAIHATHDHDTAAEPAKPRLRLIALALAAWHDHMPVPGSKAKGEPGRGEGLSLEEKARVIREDRDHRIQQTRRRERRHELGDQDTGLTGREDDRNVVMLLEWRASHAGLFWRQLDDAMTLLGQYDPRGHRVLVDVLVSPSDSRDVPARCHALAYVTGGINHAVETPRAELVKALLHLDRLLDSRAVFPVHLVEQEQGWEAWLAALKPRTTMSGKKTRADVHPSARGARDRYVRELHELAGWSQARIAANLGLSQQMVSRILGRAEA